MFCSTTQVSSSYLLFASISSAFYSGKQDKIFITLYNLSTSLARAVEQMPRSKGRHVFLTSRSCLRTFSILCVKLILHH